MRLPLDAAPYGPDLRAASGILQTPVGPPARNTERDGEA